MDEAGKINVSRYQLKGQSRDSKLEQLASYLPCGEKNCSCSNWKTTASSSDSKKCRLCEHDKLAHASQADSLTSEQLDDFVMRIADVLWLYAYIHREHDADTKQSLLVMYRDLRQSISSLSPLTEKSPPIEHPNIARCLANFSHKNSALKNVVDVSKLLIKFLNVWLIPPPTQLSKTASVAEYRGLYKIWLQYCRVPLFCQSFKSYNTCNVFGKRLLSIIYSFLKDDIAQKIVSEKRNVPMNDINKVLDLLLSEMESGGSDIFSNKYVLPSTFAAFVSSFGVHVSSSAGGTKIAGVDIDGSSCSFSEGVASPDASNDSSETERLSRSFLNECAQLASESDITLHEALPRDSRARLEEESDEIRVRIISNHFDAKKVDRDQVSLWLLQTMNVFSLQLTSMPRSYISKLVFHMDHKNLVLLSNDRVIGAICFNPFFEEGFTEIVFVAVSSSEQVKGYGTHMMNHLKDYHVRNNIFTFLTYADEFALGYFKKQAFNVVTPSAVYHLHNGLIKDYEGATLMECVLSEDIEYTKLSHQLQQYKLLLRAAEKLKKSAKNNATYPGLNFSSSVARSDPRKYGFDCIGETESFDRLQSKLKTILQQLKAQPNAWPFLQPVSEDEAHDYYDVILYPMDLSTMTKRQSQRYYEVPKLFIADFKRMIRNCKSYNSPSTEYFKCATSLDKVFVAKVKEILGIDVG